MSTARQSSEREREGERESSRRQTALLRFALLPRSSWFASVNAQVSMHTVAHDAVTQLKILAHTHRHAYIIICICIYRQGILNLDTYTCARHLISIFSSVRRTRETAETSSQFSRSPALAPSLSLSPFGNCHSNVCRSSPNYNNVGSHIRYAAGAGLRVYVAAGVDRLFHYLQCGAQALSRHGCHR